MNTNILQGSLGRISTPTAALEDICYFYSTDHLGSTSFISNVSSMPVQYISYDAFGGVLVNQRASGSSYNSDWQFSGKFLDAESGYNYFGARYYDSSLGMWLSVDPLSEKYPSLSPYAYCANNPVMLVDPNGMEIDDYFSINGKFLFRDNKKTDFIKIVSVGDNIKRSNAITFEDYITPIEKTDLSKEAITNIIEHYNNELGNIEGKSSDIELVTRDSYKKDFVMEAVKDKSHYISDFRIWDGDERINIARENGKITPLLNTASNIKNTLVHEYKHISDFGNIHSRKNREIRAINAQRKHHTYQNTTPVYKKNVDAYEKLFK